MPKQFVSKTNSHGSWLKQLLCSVAFDPNTSKVLLNANTLLVFVHQGVDEGPDGLRLISDVIQEKLGITMSVLMGANIANEVADGKFCETTIG